LITLYGLERESENVFKSAMDNLKYCKCDNIEDLLCLVLCLELLISNMQSIAFIVIEGLHFYFDCYRDLGIDESIKDLILKINELQKHYSFKLFFIDPSKNYNSDAPNMVLTSEGSFQDNDEVSFNEPIHMYNARYSADKTEVEVVEPSDGEILAIFVADE
ncbi:MAG: hypothetical protein MHPSP_003966, partial [Paramarteilia canceri]